MSSVVTRPMRAARRVRSLRRPVVLTALMLVGIASGPAAQTPTPAARNAVYVELLGNALLYSVNYERRFTHALAGRIGAMFVAGTDTDGSSAAALITPVMANYLFGAGNHHFETGLGVALASAAVDDVEDLEDDAVNGAYGTATLGYRYQRLEGGFVFRAGLTPIFDLDGFGPYLGVSVGYAF